MNKDKLKNLVFANTYLGAFIGGMGVLILTLFDIIFVAIFLSLCFGIGIYNILEAKRK